MTYTPSFTDLTDDKLAPSKVVVCRAGKCTDGQHTKINPHTDTVYTRKGNEFEKVSTLKIVSQNLVKNCTHKNGQYQCDTRRMKKGSCKDTSKGTVCVQSNDERGDIHVQCIKTGEVEVQCTIRQVCAHSASLGRVLCFNKIQRPPCVENTCYELDDLSTIKHSIVCTSRLTSSCRLLISEFCLKNGGCYQNGPAGARLQKTRYNQCARLVITQAIAARVSLHCRQHPKDVRCRIALRADRLGQHAERTISKSCKVPEGLTECRRTGLGAAQCKVSMGECGARGSELEQRQCYREIYGACITKLHLTRHYCDKESLDPVISTSCLAVEKEEIECFVMFQHCQRAATPAERQSCQKQVELKCAYFSLQYIDCFYKSHPARTPYTPSPTPSSRCALLTPLYAQCQHTLASCNSYTDKSRDSCFRGVGQGCVAVFHEYHKYKDLCVGAAQPGQAQDLSGACSTVFRAALLCTDQGQKCGTQCDKVTRRCEGVYREYTGMVNTCFEK